MHICLFQFIILMEFSEIFATTQQLVSSLFCNVLDVYFSCVFHGGSWLLFIVLIKLIRIIWHTIRSLFDFAGSWTCTFKGAHAMLCCHGRRVWLPRFALNVFGQFIIDSSSQTLETLGCIFQASFIRAASVYVNFLISVNDVNSGSNTGLLSQTAVSSLHDSTNNKIIIAAPVFTADAFQS